MIDQVKLTVPGTKAGTGTAYRRTALANVGPMHYPDPERRSCMTH